MVLARLVFMRFIHFKNKNIPSQYYAATYLSIYLSIYHPIMFSSTLLMRFPLLWLDWAENEVF